MALQVGLHEDPTHMPMRIKIGTARDFVNGCASVYNLHYIPDLDEKKGLFVCDSPTETGLRGEQIFIIADPDGEYWYACEGIIDVRAKRFINIRQACFRTKAPFWEANWHAWEVNDSRHNQPGRQYTADDQWTSGMWSGELLCETRPQTMIPIISSVGDCSDSDVFIQWVFESP
jgi:hypothetical protein